MSQLEPVKKILVAYDGSEPAVKALLHGARIAKLCNAKLYVIHVVPLPEDYISLYEHEFASKALLEGQKLLERCKEIVKALGVEAEYILEKGDPARKIVETAERLDVDYIVIGHRGMGKWERILLGSVCERVVISSTKPVIVVR
ncbi:MAG: universal stress protein [Crenarchaeota archaeon]|nr:universal stress protein [Thermoproteota archaeon]